MDPVLGHESALEYWRSVRAGSRHFRTVAHARKLLAAPPNVKDLAGPGPWWLARPFHVLVGNAGARRTSEQVKSHIWALPVPKGAVLDTQNGFCVTSPEFTFLLMSERMGLIDLVKVGFELCGSYDLSAGTVRPCQPLTTVAKLRTFVVKASHARGRKKALRALRFVIDGSASPRETVLAMLLCLPYKLGGYGIELPVLNCRIDVPARARSVSSKQFYRCDLYWPRANLALEYDSDQEHLGSKNAASDSARRIALDELGVDVVTVTTLQIASREEMERIAIHVSRCLGKRLQCPGSAFAVANLRLRTELLGRLPEKSAS